MGLLVSLCLNFITNLKYMNRKTGFQAILIFSLLQFGHGAIGQSADSTKSTLNFSGTISANNNGFSFVPTFSLGKGYLTGKMDENWKFEPGDIRGVIPRFTEEARIGNKVLLDIIHLFAERKNATPAQSALAWVLAQKPWFVPIPGTTKLHRLTENNGAVNVHFSPAELAEMEAASAQVEVMGARYTEAMEVATGL